MLKNHYSNIYHGYSPMALLFGLMSHDCNSSLCIEDSNVTYGDNWFSKISYFDLLTFQYIGKKYSIKTLININNYLIESKQLIIFDNTHVEFSSSPYINIREIIRNFPAAFDMSFINEYINTDQGEFDQYFNHMLEDYVYKTINTDGDKTGFGIEINNKYLLKFIKNLSEYFDNHTNESSQLFFILQTLQRSWFMSDVVSSDVSYFLLNSLSNSYDIDLDHFVTDLKDEFISKNGTYVKANVNDWAFYNRKAMSLLLNNRSGIISFNDCYYFGLVNSKSPFEIQEDLTIFKSFILNFELHHPLVKFYQGKKIYFVSSESLGTESPISILEFDRETLKASCTFSYYSQLGSKYSFYFNRAKEDLFNNLDQLFPGFDKAKLEMGLSVEDSEDIWISSQKDISNQKFQLTHNSKNTILVNDKNQRLKNIYYFGPQIHQYLGLSKTLLDFTRLN